MACKSVEAFNIMDKNCVNVEHIVGDAGSIAVGEIMLDLLPDFTSQELKDNCQTF